MKGLCCLRGQWYLQWERVGTELKIWAHGPRSLSVLCTCFRDPGVGGESELPSFYLFFLCMRFHIWFSEFQKIESKNEFLATWKYLEPWGLFWFLELRFFPSAHSLGTEPCKDAISSTVHRYGGRELKHGWQPLIVPISNSNCDLPQHKEACAETDNLEPCCWCTIPEQHQLESFSMNYSFVSVAVVSYLKVSVAPVMPWNWRPDTLPLAASGRCWE